MDLQISTTSMPSHATRARKPKIRAESYFYFTDTRRWVTAIDPETVDRVWINGMAMTVAFTARYYLSRPEPATKASSLLSMLVPQKPETAQGCFRHPMISYAINKVWFKNQSSLGPLYASDFKPIPNTLIAHICTCVRFLPIHAV